MENSNLGCHKMISPRKKSQDITPSELLLTNPNHPFLLRETKAPEHHYITEEECMLGGNAQREIIRQRTIFNYLHFPLHIEHVSLSRH